ncbi:hypothetical protein [Streptomyces sp. TLI_185]|uniref:hypothetical protein n=1 Tax=Streptomyces sp. TLI_185 TaxID=2485151 RepID=UPI0021A282D9|nr:hypothetical protein [Streptomyces sp. TLI_185]
MSTDPVFEPQKPQSLNGYSYAANNPATFTDPTGLSYDDIIGAIGAVIGGVVGAVLGVVGVVLGAIGNTGGTASTSSTGNTGGSTNHWTPGATFNFITNSWDTPFMNRGLHEKLAAQPDWGIVGTAGNRAPAPTGAARSGARG